jgi:hypothetical protein
VTRRTRSDSDVRCRSKRPGGSRTFHLSAPVSVSSCGGASVQSLERKIAALSAVSLYGRNEVIRQAKKKRFVGTSKCNTLGAVPVLYLTAQGVAEHYGVESSEVRSGVERAVGLTVHVSSLEQARRVPSSNGVAHLADSGEWLVVPAAQAQRGDSVVCMSQGDGLGFRPYAP